MKLRNTILTINEFGDFELIPLFRLAQSFSDPSSAVDLSKLMTECYRSLRSIFGDDIIQFWDEDNQRLKLHSAELAMLTKSASDALNASTSYQDSTKLVMDSPQEQANKGFAQAVRDKVLTPSSPSPSQQIDAVVANQQKLREIEELERQLAVLKGE